MSEEVSDEVLMVRIRNRDEAAFRTLIERHQNRVYGTVARMLGGAGPEAEETAQDIFLRVWRSAGTFRGEGKFTTWLMSITRNLVFTRLGRLARRGENEGEVPVDGETGESTLESRPDPVGQTPSEKVSFRELEQAVEAACAGLPENQRWVIHLRQYEGMDLEEIGKITGLSLTAVKSLIFRARENLKKKLSGYLTASK